MFCPSCGNKTSDEAQFCPFCGFKIPNAPQSSANTLEVEASTATETSTTSNNLSADSLKAAVDSTRKRSRRRMPLILVVALVLALASSAAFAAYYVYTNVWLPSQTQSEESTTTAAEPVEYSVESTTVSVSVPAYGVSGRESDEWSYDLISCTQQSAAVDKINSAIKESFESSVELVESSSNVIDDPTALTCVLSREIKITYIDDTIVCFQDKRYSTAWGAHGWPENTGVVYSLETGEPLDMAALFEMDEESLISATQAAFTTWLSSNTDQHSITDYSEATESAAWHIENLSSSTDDPLLTGSMPFYIDENGLAYMTGAYELGSYADGVQSIYVAAFDDESIIGTTAVDIQ